MPPQMPRIMLSIDPATVDALDYLTERYGLSRSAMIRLAVRRMAETEGWERGKAPALAAS
jgi:metal-responsive CopG/Arc/MetJ family transcriptional regulator